MESKLLIHMLNVPSILSFFAGHPFSLLSGRQSRRCIDRTVDVCVPPSSKGNSSGHEDGVSSWRHLTTDTDVTAEAKFSDPVASSQGLPSELTVEVVL